MTSRERVRRAIRFQRPDRLPCTGSMAATDFSGDTVAVFPDFPMKWWLGGGGTDEWGCRWEVGLNPRDMGQVVNTVLDDLADYASIPLPPAADPARYAHLPAILDRAEAEGKYVVFCNGCLVWERLHFLHGFENCLMAALDTPDLLLAAGRHVARYHLDTIAYLAAHFPGRIHGYRGTDDLGTQTAAMLSPATFARVLQPVYAELFAAARAAGMDAWQHSCGQILDLLPLLADAGLQVVNVMQPNVFPIPRLAALRGRLCFEVAADIQTTLPHLDRPALAAEIQALLDACCTPDGGLIEVRLDRMYFEGLDVPREVGDWCHAEYRARDPFA